MEQPDYGPFGAIPRPVGPVLDFVFAQRFLRAQSSWLIHGLDHADDRREIAFVVSAHDATHDVWLGLIANARRQRGSRAGQELAALYGFHGHVVGSLERGPDPRVSPAIADEIHHILASRLEELTETAIDALRGDRPAPRRETASAGAPQG